ncbi:head GIN domain-containing protein [Novosphingobium sp.]|uniref:head GIN domain-containing protein n=1 Tax=Novosphingobium sp. TaxID=1874826 RepID=UPI0025F914D4|nr:head GIN domain-containing protein [Novosphingobium sp.]
MIKDIVRTLGGIAVAAIALSLSACDGVTMEMNGMKGVRLAELDLTAKAPEEITLLGPDNVRVVQGDKLAITVEGNEDAKDRLRFVLKDGKLAIGREGWKIGGSDDLATINVTVPAARRLVMAGSGTMHADALRGDAASISIAGSGDIEVPVVDTNELKVEVIGSGDFKAGGKAKSLKISVAGSGSADLAGLSAEDAKVEIAGSGDARFASDGQVKADIMGSGSVTVKGRAQCKVNAMGSGTLTCEP